MKKSLGFWTLLPWLLITSGVLFLIFRLLIRRDQTHTTDPDPDPDPVPVDEEPEEEPQTREQRIRNHFQLIRSILPPVWSNNVVSMITAQAMHETGVFTSRLYKEQNNLFGMRHPTIRSTTSVGEEAGYARFANLEDSVKDLVLYFDEFKYPKRYEDVAAYVKALKGRGYFTAPYVDYFNAVRKHYNVVRELIQ